MDHDGDDWKRFPPSDNPIQRRRVWVRGLVQGVGFRPYVYRLAQRVGLSGFVCNISTGVLIEIEGSATQIERFLTILTAQPPPLARIEQIAWHAVPPRGDSDFRIETSLPDVEGLIHVAPDLAPCPDCLREMNDPSDRRFLYPFLNCTNCGPRLTIITGAPFDRCHTTMADFPLCPDCLREFHDPADRRFHAQAIACPRCGPQLSVWPSRPAGHDAADPLLVFADAIRAGKIGALKGVGGYHLVCDARLEDAVRELRRRKNRETKPLALMVADLALAEALAEVSPLERELLLSPRRPIVLMRRRLPSPIAPSVAPDNPYLGIMLPPSPLHVRLVQVLGGIPLVMTSGNLSDEPIAIDDDDARRRLAPIADLFLGHNRRIHIRCDDSVTRVIDETELPVRRSRGDAPGTIRLPRPCPMPILALGGQLKAVFALGLGQQAVLSHHLGDLDHRQAWEAYRRDLQLYEKLFAFRPEVIVHDLHPDYATTRYAEDRARGEGLSRLAVQHHHAHLASCLADQGIDETVIGVTFDGTGLGTDGAIWGGEFLVGDCREFRRLAHLRYVRMPGGDQAIREPWRMALAHLHDAGISCSRWEQRLPATSRRIVERIVERPGLSPATSSMGRLFDAVASLLGVADRVADEGEAAMKLEWLAEKGAADDGLASAYPFDLRSLPGRWEIDTRPMIADLVRDVEQSREPAQVARRFHVTVAQMIVQTCKRLREATGLDTVVLSGGVFLNAWLTRTALSQLRAERFTVVRHRQVPPGDGGLCLGQLAIAAARSAGGA